MNVDGNRGPVSPKSPGKGAAPTQDDAPGDPSLDKVTDGLGIQGVAQDGTRATALAARKGSTVERVARHANEVLMGDRLALGPAMRQVGRTVAQTTPDVQRVAAPALGAVRGLSRVGAAIGRLGPVISIPFAGYDVYKAVSEPDPSRRPSAAANASLTVLGTALGAGAVVVGSVPLAVGMLATSMAVGAFQLVDAYTNEGKATEQLGNTVARWLSPGEA